MPHPILDRLTFHEYASFEPGQLSYIFPPLDILDAAGVVTVAQLADFPGALLGVDTETGNRWTVTGGTWNPRSGSSA